MASAPVIIEHLGWPWVFYLFSIFGLVWTILWVIFGANSAEESAWISDAERAYVLSRVPPPIDPKTESVPWGVILKAKSFWAIVICTFCQAWAFYLFLSWLPTYIKDDLHFGLVATGVISMAPYAVDTVGAIVSGYLSDLAIIKGVSRKAVRKFNTAEPMLATSAFLACLCFPITPEIFIVLLLIYHVCYSINNAGISVNPLDLAPRHSGILMSILNTIGNIPGVVGTILAGFILQSTGSWTSIWLIACGLNVIGAVVYLIWGSADVIVP